MFVVDCSIISTCPLLTCLGVDRGCQMEMKTGGVASDMNTKGVIIVYRVAAHESG